MPTQVKLTEMEEKEADKGKEIRFVKGNYKGKGGWIDKSKKKTKASRNVIVDMGTGPDDADSDDESQNNSNQQKYCVATRVMRDSIRSKFDAPKSYEEAALQQHFDIEEAMINLAEKFAECKASNIDAISSLFSKELKRAKKSLMKKGKGYREVQFGTGLKRALENTDSMAL